MAVQTITYDDKSYINLNADIPATNKVQDTDMNEIKSVVNNNASELTTAQTNISGLKYNLITAGTEVKTGRQIDGKDEYVVIINAGAGPNNTSITIDYSHTDKIIHDYYLIGISSTDETIKAPNAASGSNYFNIFFEQTKINISSNQDRSRFTCYVYIYYTYKA